MVAPEVPTTVPAEGYALCDDPTCPTHSDVATRLIYAEDLTPGTVVRIPGARRDGPWLMAYIAGGAVRVGAWGTVLEVRRAGGTTVAIVVDGDGLQVPLYATDLELLRVRVD